MNTKPPSEPETDSLTSPLFISDGESMDIPPDKRKIDPSTIDWPDGIPKPWEKPEPPAKPSTSS